MYYITTPMKSICDLIESQSTPVNDVVDEILMEGVMDGDSYLHDRMPGKIVYNVDELHALFKRGKNKVSQEQEVLELKAKLENELRKYPSISVLYTDDSNANGKYYLSVYIYYKSNENQEQQIRAVARALSKYNVLCSITKKDFYEHSFKVRIEFQLINKISKKVTGTIRQFLSQYKSDWVSQFSHRLEKDKEFRELIDMDMRVTAPLPGSNAYSSYDSVRKLVGGSPCIHSTGDGFLYSFEVYRINGKLVIIISNRDQGRYKNSSRTVYRIIREL